MTPLANQSLTSCNKTCSALSDKEIQQHLARLDGWQAHIEQDAKQIIKIFSFKNYVMALAFTNRIAALAEKENHHPKIILEWGKVSVSWWTHTLDGLFINDFIMASRCDGAYLEEGE